MSCLFKKLLLILGVIVAGCPAALCLEPGSDGDAEALGLLVNTFREIRENYVDEISGDELFRQAVLGMLSPLDPHCELLLPDAYRQYRERRQGGYGGVGLAMKFDDNGLVVVRVAAGGPAHLAGISRGDRIVEIEGVAAQDLRDRPVSDLLQGRPGSRVDLAYTREGFETPMRCTLTRQIVKVAGVRTAMPDPDGLGYLAIFAFSDSTTDEVVEGLEELESSASGLKGLVLDLRNNPGGPLEQAVDVADVFLDQGTIVSVHGRRSRHTRVYEAAPGAVSRRYPLVVLINGGSASSAEILAAALQDHGRAKIAGTPSFGKGSVQATVPLGRGYGLKFTIARYYSPNNRPIQGRGIVPDILLDAGGLKPKDPAASQVRAALDILRGLTGK